jgi:hypothetical protein
VIIASIINIVGLLTEPWSGCTTKCTQLKEADDFMQSKSVVRSPNLKCLMLFLPLAVDVRPILKFRSIEFTFEI